MIWQHSRVVFESFVLFYFILINSSYTILFLFAFFEVRKQNKRSFIDDYEYFFRSKLAPKVSLLITAYNEKLSIIDSIKSYLRLHYPFFEVIIINDGSTDSTLELLTKEFDLKETYRVLRNFAKCQPIKAYYISDKFPNLIVIDKINGGKADALNAGLNASHYPYFASMDADALLQPDALLRIMKPFFENSKENVGAGGIIRIINGCKEENGVIQEVKMSSNPLVIFQVLEYIRSFTAGRTAFSNLDSLPISSGAFSVYNTAIAREMGGYDPSALGEDFEFLVRLHRHMRDRKREYKVRFCVYAICCTEVPATFRTLGSQRNRWHRGLTSVLAKHKAMMFKLKYGRIGMFSLPFYFFLEFIGPLIEATGYIYIITLFIWGSYNPVFVLAFLALSILWGVLISLLAVLFEDLNFAWYRKWHHLATLIIFAFLENISYRQVTVFWRIQGLIDYIRGNKSWGFLKREGFSHH